MHLKIVDYFTRRSAFLFFTFLLLTFLLLAAFQLSLKLDIPFIKKIGIYSISIYTGSCPFKLSPANSIKIPTLTANDVLDVSASFVADPFMIKYGSVWYMFFEVMNRMNQQGEIGLAKSLDGLNWSYEGIVLNESFHLSYPFVFENGGHYFMIPECVESGAVRLYVAESFPTKWRFIKNLIEARIADPTLFFYQNKFWLFGGETRVHPNDTLSLYMADDIMGPWTKHPLSPIIKGDSHRARPAGRIIIHGGNIYRFAQDDSPKYGNAVRVFEVKRLTPTSYEEDELPNSPILKATGKGWNADGMHQVDLHQIDEENWIACVDGWQNKVTLEVH